ncbi:hypothetical protein F5051DRAFT_330350 [Lentinula edodes]|nr:hypothetical protein F5051DRAFT_330350 [Lentinula edodes]
MVVQSSGTRPPQWGPEIAREVFIVTRGLGGSVLSWGRAVVLPQLEFSAVPDVTKHWALLIGDTYHQLEKASVQHKPKEWYDGFTKYSVGWTNLDDNSIKWHGNWTIDSMPPTYDLTANNCQIFTLGLMNRIAPGCRQFKTL